MRREPQQQAGSYLTASYGTETGPFMTTSQILLLLAGAVGLMWKVRNLFQENRARARKRMEESAERRWGIKRSGLFDEPDEDEDDALWE